MRCILQQDMAHFCVWGEVDIFTPGHVPINPTRFVKRAWGTTPMTRLRALLPKLFVIMSLAVGRFPRLVTLLDRVHEPCIACVWLTRRRPLTYAEFFTLLDRDGCQAALTARADVAPHRTGQRDEPGSQDCSAQLPSRRWRCRVTTDETLVMKNTAPIVSQDIKRTRRTLPFYRVLVLEPVVGFEPTTGGLQNRCSGL